jgi:hypothetical protein
MREIYSHYDNGAVSWNTVGVAGEKGSWQTNDLNTAYEELTAFAFLTTCPLNINLVLHTTTIAQRNGSQPLKNYRFVPLTGNSVPKKGLIFSKYPIRFSVWWPEDKDNPDVAHACRKRRLKCVPSALAYSCVTLSHTRRPGPPSWGMGVGLTAPAL